MAEKRFVFTQDKLTKLVCPPSGKPECDGRLWVYDDRTPGLAFVVTETGSKSFYLYRRIEGKPVKYRLGGFHELTVTTAREQAAIINGEIGQKRNPIAERKAERVESMKAVATVGNLWAAYRDQHLANKKPTTQTGFAKLYENHLAKWKDRDLKGITPEDVELLKGRIGEDNGQYLANRVVALLSAMFRRRGHTFGLQRGWSPTAGVDPFPEAPRDRVLTTDELSRILNSIEADENPTARDYFKMLLYTGMRKTSVATMAWQDLNEPAFTTWRIPGAKTKNGKPLVVNLVGEAVAILKARYESNPADSPYVFPGRCITPGQVEAVRTLRSAGKSTHAIADELGIGQTSVMHILQPDYKQREPSAFDGAGKAWARVLARAGMRGKGKPRTTLHDLRRTFCTNLIERGVPLPIVSAAMGHRSMETTSRHYSFASDKAVAEATRSSMAGLMADVAKVQKKQSRNAKGAA